MRKILTLLFTFSLVVSLRAQNTLPVEGLSDVRDITYAFRNATLVTDSKTLIKDAVLIIRKDKIVQAGAGIPIPPGAVIYDLKGKYVYPSFIEMSTGYGLPETREKKERDRGPQNRNPVAGPVNWNMAIHPESDAISVFTPDPKQAEDLRKIGFGTALTLQRDGIARGTGALVLLGDDKAQLMVLRDKAAAGFSFNKGSSVMEYPSSLMGSIALLRQTYLDATWYAGAKDQEYNLSLEALNKTKNLPQIFEVKDYKSALRADRIGDEFGITYIVIGSGDEYKRLNEIRSTGCSFVLPLSFPKAYDVSNPYDALNISLAELKHWELAPANPGLAEKAGLRFALTSDGLKEKKEFIPALLKAIRCGLSKEAALNALTTIPATMLGVADKVGALRPGMTANFFICTKDYFEKDNQLLENWVAGKRYIIRNSDSLDLRGKYALQIDTLKDWTLVISGDVNTPEWSLQKDTLKIKIEATPSGAQYTLRFETAKGKGPYRINALYDAATAGFTGNGQLPDGTWKSWKASKTGIAEEKKDSAKRDTGFVLPAIFYPSGAFGYDYKVGIGGGAYTPSTGACLIKNITIWTCEDQGIIENGSVLIRDGKIVAVGKNAEAEKWSTSGVRVIDGTGMHLTPGIIDEHSHIAVNGGVNEGTQSITSEVRIGDVIDPDDIDIYRQLAGGVTTSHLLHGSANAVGGQTALIKLRWGKGAEELKFKGADPFIKFALGENVKQSNWGDNNVTRYPQTRMGVEQLYIDAFSRARAYDTAWKTYTAGGKTGNSVMPRRDLELEALAEIINKKRFITCHSYQQGEINMLMHVADTFGFRVNTFTHILEGYKVADKMKKHGVGGSTFSDWWAYKYEVIDAIPYNGALLYKNGIITAFNSDDAEMARRLNQEAAKAVKYGNVPEAEALKFVTLNPAKLLHIDNRTGSIKAGKDADLVIWNGPPLSVYSKPVQTWVDGVLYFDLTTDAELRARDDKERQRIIRKMLDEKAGGSPTQRPGVTLREEYHCNDLEKLPY
ncbi:MAG: amidohydrolase family protein [Bacteroidia bacterium]